MKAGREGRSKEGSDDLVPTWKQQSGQGVSGLLCGGADLV